MLPVGDSAELCRILALPRRKLSLSPAFPINSKGPCECQALGRECIQSLYPIQITALQEAVRANGLFAPISVGAGKTVIGLLLPIVMELKPAVYLCLPGHEKQVRAEHRWLSQHVNVPTLDKELHIVSYSVLSLPRSSGLLERLNPKIIIADECHRLRHPNSVGSSRVFGYMGESEGACRFAAWTGTPTNRSISDFSHLLACSLQAQSPLPLDIFVREAWATAVDASKYGNAPEGALAKLKSHPKESTRHAIHRRIVETEGVVYSMEKNTEQTDLIFQWLDPSGPRSARIEQAIKRLEETWTRPDGEELIYALDVYRLKHELNCGFYYAWDFSSFPMELVIAWKEARAQWNKALRNSLRSPIPGYDSPALIVEAIKNGVISKGVTFDRYHAWQAIATKVLPPHKTVWLEDSFILTVKNWADRQSWPDRQGKRYLIWYTHAAVGQRLGCYMPVFDRAEDLINQIRMGAHSHKVIALSVNACGAGIDGLQYMFADQLISCPMDNGAELEQLLGRLSRTGQTKPVTTTFFRRDKECVDRAIQDAKYHAETIGIPQKLLMGKWKDGY